MDDARCRAAPLALAPVPARRTSSLWACLRRLCASTCCRSTSCARRRPPVSAALPSLACGTRGRRTTTCALCPACTWLTSGPAAGPLRCPLPAVTEMEGFNSHLNMEQMNKVSLGSRGCWHTPHHPPSPHHRSTGLPLRLSRVLSPRKLKQGPACLDERRRSSPSTTCITSWRPLAGPRSTVRRRRRLAACRGLWLQRSALDARPRMPAPALNIRHPCSHPDHHQRPSSGPTTC